MLKKILCSTVLLSAMPAMAQGTFRAPGGLDPTNQVSVSGSVMSLGQLGVLATKAVPQSSVGQPNGPAQLGPDGSLGLVPLGGGRTGSQANAQINANAAGITGEIARATGAEGLLIPKADIGAASGVAGLDANGNAVAPVLTGQAQIGTSPARTTYAGSSAQKPVVSLFAPQQYDGNLPSAGLTPWQDMMMLGGLQADSKAFLSVYGQPYGGGNNAVVDAVYMNGMSAGQGTGVTAGGFTSMVNYMNNDAVARETRTGSTPPKFVASAVVPDPSGASHAVTFSGTGATFSPALPSYWGAMLRVGMNVVTNENGVAVGKITQNTFLQPYAGNTFRRPFTMYFGTITSWQTNADGSIAGITVDGWAVPQQNLYGLGSALGAVPGQTMLDGSQPSLDTQFTNWTAPAIMFGMYTKAFVSYSLCDLEPWGARGDINAPNGYVGSLVHECGDERDLWNHDPTPYLNSLQGYTVAVDNTGGGALTNDSYGFGIGGGKALPVGFISWDLAPGGAPAYTAMATGNGNRSVLYSPSDLGLALGSYHVAQNWMFSAANGGNLTSNLRIEQYRDVDETAATSAPDNTTNSVHVQWRSDATGNPTLDDGVVGGQVVYNPPGYMYGIGLGAGGSFQTPNYGLLVDSYGNDYVGKSGNLNFMNSTGTNVGGFNYSTTYSLLYDNLSTEFSRPVRIDAASSGLTVNNKVTAGSLEVNTAAQFDLGIATDTLSPHTSGGQITASALINATEGVVAPSVATPSGVGPAYPTFTFATLPTSGLVDGQHVRCSDCKLNSHMGVDAVWNAGASEWTDMMDNALSH